MYNNLNYLIYSSHKTSSQSLDKIFKINNINTEALHYMSNIHIFYPQYMYITHDNKLSYITPFSLKIGTLNYLVFSSYLFIKSSACINK